MKRLRELRKTYNLSMRDLGNAFSLSESTISLYESGKRQPDNEILIKFAKYFHVTTDYLLECDNNVDITTTLKKYDIKGSLEGLRDTLRQDQNLFYDGYPLSKETLDYLKNAITLTISTASIINKEKSKSSR